MSQPGGGGVGANSASIRALIEAAHPVEEVVAPPQVEASPQVEAPPDAAAGPVLVDGPVATPEPPAASTEGLLADGIYRDPTVGRWTRLALASFAVLAVFSGAAVSSSAVAFGVLVAIAVVLLIVRSVLKRPRLVVRAEGIVVVRRFGSSSVGWADVLSAGAAPAPPPLGKVERVLAIKVAGGRELQVSSLRDGIDRRTGEAPRVVEMAAALAARAEWSNAPR